ncbi:hypothetical protein QQS21_009192 [Conoideocrella luteorostrata]|uniref:Uncharacterized protein n=1 Tax=Conoideocrella luteorostrata TaxID=1105319 RepID=A0AAJ0CIA5_9HYPO|nr:hypothetical protein QQS21_009192 [Conoideocrella luteorostrata]
MVRLRTLLNLSLGLAAHARSQDGNIVSDDAAALHGTGAKDVPSYAANLERFHHTVKRARSVIESRGASVSVPESELHSILTKIEELEKQVKALLGGDEDSEKAASAPGSGPGSSTSAKYASDDQACDAENLIYDLGARAVVDADGKVSDHPLFRRNANCPMESAVKGKKGSDQAGSGSDGDASGTGAGNMRDSEAPADSQRSGNEATPVSSAAASNVPLLSIPPVKTSPAVADAAAKHNTPDTSPYSPEMDGSKGDDTTSPAAKPKNVVQGNIPPAASTPSSAPKQAASDTLETVETQTLPINGKYVTTTITRTTTRRSTVTVAMPDSQTDVAEGGEYEDNDRALPTGLLTATGGKPDRVHGTEPMTPEAATLGSSSIPALPISGSFRKFSNGTMMEKFVNGTSNKNLASGSSSKKLAANTLPGKAKPSSSQSTPHKIVKLTATHHPAANKNVHQMIANSTVHDKMMSLAASNTLLQTAQAASSTSMKAAMPTKPTPGDKFVDGATNKKFFNSTSSEEIAHNSTQQDAKMSTPSPNIKVVNVIPVPAQKPSSESLAWTAPSTAMASPVTSKPLSFSKLANGTSNDPATGFKTVRIPQSQRSMMV